MSVRQEGRGPRDLCSLAWVAGQLGAGWGWVLVGGRQGLAGWRISTRKVKSWKPPLALPEMVKYRYVQSLSGLLSQV